MNSHQHCAGPAVEQKELSGNTGEIIDLVFVEDKKI